MGETDFVGGIGRGASWVRNEEVQSVLSVLTITIAVHSVCVINYLGSLFICAAPNLRLCVGYLLRGRGEHHCFIVLDGIQFGFAVFDFSAHGCDG